ncbi:MAG: hypothetical protein K2M96_02100 [Prevotella sp.]|nr:hypothetical protein [Prevotella sp.]
MRIRKTLAALFMLPLLCACQSEGYQEAVQQQRVIKVGAYLPNSNDTRAQIKYGSGRDETGETFMWIYNDDYKDWITIFNITKLVDGPTDGVELAITKLSDDRKRAEFESVESVDSTYKIEEGDVILAMSGELRRYQQGTAEGWENVFTYDVGTQANRPQYIVENPNDESLSYMKDNLKMYDIVRAGEGGQIPDLHFKHLSALLRVTLRNETGDDLYFTKIEFKYPGTESFFNTTMYFSVDSDTLKVYDDGEFYGENDKIYTDEIGTTVSGKNGTTDVGGSIANGESYELYASTVPRIGNNRTGKSFEILLTREHDTNNPYSITFDDFDTVIEAGKRYWFDLTAIITPEGERKLMLTSEWKKQQEEQGKTPEENTQETD